jgi:hypothetical protein
LNIALCLNLTQNRRTLWTDLALRRTRVPEVVSRVALVAAKPNSLVTHERPRTALVLDVDQRTSIVDLMRISSACQQGSRSSSLPICTQDSHQNRLTEQISDELHALRSAEETSPVKHFSLISDPNLQSIPEDGNTAMSTQPMLYGSAWLRITDSDFTWSYKLGTLNLEPQTVIELFQ